MARPSGRTGRFIVVLAMAVGAACLPHGGLAWIPTAAAAESAATPWYEAITVNGFASTSFSYNFNRPPARTNAFRVFDVDDKTFKVDVVELVAQHTVTRIREAGFRADLAFGSSIPRVSAARGLFRDPGTGAAEDVDLQQAYVSYIAPIGKGLRLDGGKFVTLLGAEVIDGYDGWNDNATRSLLFGFAIPFTHTGARASYNFSSRGSGTLMVVNGWDNATDNNTAKTVGAQLGYTPVPELTVLVTGITGPERDGDNHHARRVGDVLATYQATPSLRLVVNADLGTEQGLFLPGSLRSAQWKGAAVYARWQATERFALIGRAEGFDDRDGARTGLVQTLHEFTVTAEHKCAPHAIMRADLRHDRSDHDAFASDTGFKDSQTTLFLNVMAMF